MTKQILRNRNRARYDTKADAAYAVLRENIVNGHLKPGTKLLQKRIADELGVSEIPVREAIKRLQAEGFVTVTPHSGAQVAEFNQEEMQEALAIRSVLEGFAARTGALRASAKDIEKLESILEKMKKCVEEKDDARYGTLNQEFHNSLYALSPYKRLQRMINEIWYGAERTRSVFALVPGRLEASYAEHRQIVDAVKAGLGEKVEELVRQHRLTVAKHLQQYVAQPQEGGIDREH